MKNTHTACGHLLSSPSLQKVYTQYTDREKHTTATMIDMADTK